MALMAKKSGEGFDPIPQGTYQAVCYGVVDLGVQLSTGIYAGKKAHKICIFWEVPEHRIQIEKDGKKIDLPRVISKQYTLSLNEKATLFADLQSWRGKAFTEEELNGFDVFNVIGANCILTIVHNDNKKAKVSAVTNLMKGMKRLIPENPIMKYAMSTDGFTIPETLYDWVKKQIMESEDYKAVAHARKILGVDQPALEEEQGEEWGDPADASSSADMGDSIPF
jgi:hypothetical protein